jgi:hypothetical protein
VGHRDSGAAAVARTPQRGRGVPYAAPVKDIEAVHPGERRTACARYTSLRPVDGGVGLPRIGRLVGLGE